MQIPYEKEKFASSDATPKEALHQMALSCQQEDLLHRRRRKRGNRVARGQKQAVPRISRRFPLPEGDPPPEGGARVRGGPVGKEAYRPHRGGPRESLLGMQGREGAPPQEGDGPPYVTGSDPGRNESHQVERHPLGLLPEDIADPLFREVGRAVCFLWSPDPHPDPREPQGEARLRLLRLQDAQGSADQREGPTLRRGVLPPRDGCLAFHPLRRGKARGRSLLPGRGLCQSGRGRPHREPRRGRRSHHPGMGDRAFRALLRRTPPHLRLRPFIREGNRALRLPPEKELSPPYRTWARALPHRDQPRRNGRPGLFRRSGEQSPRLP